MPASTRTALTERSVPFFLKSNIPMRCIGFEKGKWNMRFIFQPAGFQEPPQQAEDSDNRYGMKYFFPVVFIFLPEIRDARCRHRLLSQRHGLFCMIRSVPIHIWVNSDRKRSFPIIGIPHDMFSGILTVQVDLTGVIHSAEMEEYFISFPLFRNGEG